MTKQTIWRAVGVCGGVGLALALLAMLLVNAWPMFSPHTAFTVISPPAPAPAPMATVGPMTPASPPPRLTHPLQPAKLRPAPSVKRAADAIVLANVVDVIAKPHPARAAPPSWAKATVGGRSPATHRPPTLRKRPDLADLSSLITERRFVMAMCRDQSGNLWLGCEDEGIWRLDAKGKWTQFTTKDGLGDDNAYALAVDQQGRIWAGHLNHGVSVYNGSANGRPAVGTGKWQCYEVVGGLSRPDTLSGPLGERVFDIAVCPTDGDVWIATNAGLSRYSPSHDDWSYYTRGMSAVHGTVTVASGQLPVASEEQSQSTGNRLLATGNLFPASDQVQAIAFDAEGNIYCATQCDGMAMADARDGYSHWRNVHGPGRMPTEPAGDGLPTNLMNDVLVARDGTIYAATTTGLAWSKDKGQSWFYIRGEDYAAKVKGRYGGPPQGWTEKQPSEVALATGNRQPATSLLPEDYVTCLAEGPDGLLWVGYRSKGYESIDPKTGKQVPALGSDKKFVTALLPTMQGQLPAVGTYGDGQDVPPGTGLASTPTTPSTAAALPAAAAPLATPALADLRERLHGLAAEPASKPPVVALTDDWRTQGAWLGRYGRYWACLAAMATHDYLWGAGPQPVEYVARIGPHHEPGDSIRYYLHWPYTKSPKSLEIPPVYLDSRVIKGLTTREVDRRESEWDDHGESYAPAWEGPDTYVTLKIPAGAFTLSLYDMNKDGHEGPNRYRDYQVSVRLHPQDKPLRDITDFDTQPELAHARIHNFWGGVYKRFGVRGPTQITVKVSKSNSFNTIVAGMMLDPVEERMASYFPQPTNSPTTHPTAAPLDGSKPRLVMNEAAQRLYSVAVLRQAASDSQPRNEMLSQLATAYYQIAAYPHWEECQTKQGLTTARQIEKTLRWDQKIPAYSGRGYQTVTEYLSAHPQINSNPPAVQP